MADVETEPTEAPEAPEATEAELAAHDAEGIHHHPHPSAYVGIAILLALITAGEIGLFYVKDISDTWNTILLLIMMVVKFALVALWFMHLRFEAPIFKRLFVGGILLAVSVYAVVLGSEHVFPVLVDADPAPQVPAEG
jgi:cytochrome c oxidase subunit 4